MSNSRNPSPLDYLGIALFGVALACAVFFNL